MMDYGFNFVKSVFKMRNIPVIVYLILNIMIVIEAIYLFTNKLSISICLGIVLYFAFLMIALSPAGEWMLRKRGRCIKIDNDAQSLRLNRLFNKVYAKAILNTSEIEDKIELFMLEDDMANAFALGRKTIVCTTGLLYESDEVIEGILAHEFGHLAHHDTDYLLMVHVGNIMINGIILFVNLIRNLIVMMYNLTLYFIPNTLPNYLMVLFLKGLIFICNKMIDMVIIIWGKIGDLLLLNNMRNNEYRADRYAYELGYREPLIHFLLNDEEVGNNTFIENLLRTHPKSQSRIERLVSYE